MRRGLPLILILAMLLSSIATMAFAAIDSIQLSRSTTAPVGPKGTINFTAKAYEGATLVKTAKFTWSCVPAAGKVSTSGSFTASTTPGAYAKAVTVTVSGTAISASADVRIIPGPASKIVIDGNKPLTIACAGTHAFSAVVTDSYGNVIPGAAPIIYSLSGGAKVGTITTAGAYVAGSIPGKYSNAVVAKYGKASGQLSVTVTAPPPTRVALYENKTIAAATKQMEAGSKTTFSAIGYDSLGRPIAGLKFKFTSIGNGGTINATSGAFTAATTAGNTATVSAQALINNLPAGALGTTAITIKAAAASKIVITPATAAVEVVKTRQFSASAADKYGNTVSSGSIVWSVKSGGSISTTGLYTAGTKPGSYSSSVVAASGKLKSAANVTVLPAPPTKVQLYENKVAVGATKQMEAGTKTTFSAIGYINDRPIEGLKFKFTSTGNGGTINATSGAFTAATTAGNTATVSAQALINGAAVGALGTTAITIKAAAASKMVINPATVSIECGKTQQFSASATDKYSNTVPSSSIVWSVKSGGIMSPSGLYTAGLKPGKYPSSIIATSGKLKSAASVTVTPAAPARVKLTIGSVDAVVKGANVVAGSNIVLNPEAYDASSTKITYLTFRCTIEGAIGTITSGNTYKAATTAGTNGKIVIQPLYSSAPCGAAWKAGVAIVPNAPKTVDVDPDSAMLGTGETKSFSVLSVKDVYNNVIKDAQIAWSASSATAGTIKAGAPTTTATFTAGSTTGDYTIKALATTALGSAFAVAKVKVSNEEDASEHLQRLITADNPDDIDMVAENKWFTDYVTVNPSDPAGRLGLSISRVGKTTYQLAQKYGITQSSITSAITFNKTLSISTSKQFTDPQEIVLGMFANRSAMPDFGSIEVSFARGESVPINDGVLAMDFTPDQIASDIKNSLIPAINDAIGALGTIADTDSLIFTFHDADDNERTVYGCEVRAYRAGLKAVVGVLDTVAAYSWSTGTFSWNKSLSQFDKNADKRVTPSEYLPGGSFMTLTSTSLLNAGWTALNGAIDDAIAVADRMQDDNVDPKRILAQLAGPDHWVETGSRLAAAKSALAGPTTVPFEFSTLPFDNQSTVLVMMNPRAFWINPISDLRTKMPTFSYMVEYGKAYGEVYSIPDKTLGGVLPNGAAQIPAAWWSDKLNFFGDEGDNSWCDIQPLWGEDDVAADTDIIIMPRYNVTAFSVYLDKRNASGGWSPVQIVINPDGPPPPAYGGISYVFYKATSLLASNSVYRVRATCDRGRVTTYFRSK